MYVDEQPILEQGRWRLDPAVWQLDHHTVALPALWWQGVEAVRRSGSRYGWEEGRLVRYWSSRSGQHNGLLVGCEETARRAGQLLRLLQDQVNSIAATDLVERAGEAGIPAAEVPALVWTLQRYDLLRVEGRKTP